MTSLDEQGKGLTMSVTNWYGDESVRWPNVSVSLCQLNDIVVIEYFNKKGKCCNHWCPDSVYFNTLLLIIYLNAIETHICRREMTLIVSTSFGFAQNTIHDFQNTLLNSWWRCLTTNATKIKVHPALTESGTLPHIPAACISYRLG